jgi:hypothetical protein
MNFEKAKRFGDRHLTGNTNFELDAPCGRTRLVRITASPEVAATVAGQHCLWMLTNLLARQFGIITALAIDIPAVPVVPGVALFGAGRTLRETLVNTASLVASSALLAWGNTSRGLLFPSQCWPMAGGSSPENPTPCPP